MILDPLTLLLGLLSLLLGLFVLLFGLLFGLLHLLQRLLLLLLSLIVTVIGGEAAVADQVGWGLGDSRSTGPLAGVGKSTAMSAKRTDPVPSMVSVASGRAASNSASIAMATPPAKISCIIRNCRRRAPAASVSWEPAVVVMLQVCAPSLAISWEAAVARI